MSLLDSLRASVSEGGENSGDGKEYAPAWRWERPGDGVEGVIVSIDSRINDNHPDGYPIVTLRQEDGTDIAVHAFVTVLKNEVNEKGMRVGDVMAAIYDGKKTSGAGRQFHAFRVAHQPGTGGPIPAPAPAPAAAPASQVKDPWETVPTTNSEIPPF